ncbi:MAG: carboxypeptidase-like regulatory domain-containing protein [Bacteroidota bacterium]
MKKNQPIKFHIASHCHQNWEAMERNETGRHCGQCQKTVVDFSQLTDTQLFGFFSQHKDTHCGRFRNTQLQRDILPLQTPSNRVSRVNAFAAIVTIVALNTAQVFGQKRNRTTKQEFALVENTKEKLPKQKVTVTGTITNENGGVLENAKVAFDSIATTTDKDGRFSFEITNDNTDFHHLYFSYEGMVSEVRSYHPAMGATSFDVRLEKPDPLRCRSYVMGGISSYPTTDFPTLEMKKDQLILSKDNLDTLSIIAVKIKAFPGMLVQIVAYADKAKHKLNAQKRLDAIVKFLVKKMGIDTERLRTKIDNSVSVDTIDFISIDPSED